MTAIVYNLSAHKAAKAQVPIRSAAEARLDDLTSPAFRFLTAAVLDFMMLDASKGFASLSVEIERGPSHQTFVARTNYLTGSLNEALASGPVVHLPMLVDDRLQPFQATFSIADFEQSLALFSKALGRQSWCLERPATMPVAINLRLVGATVDELFRNLVSLNLEIQVDLLPDEALGEHSGFLVLHPSGVVRSAAIDIVGDRRVRVLDPLSLIDPEVPSSEPIDITCRPTLLVVNPVGEAGIGKRG